MQLDYGCRNRIRKRCYEHGLYARSKCSTTAQAFEQQIYGRRDLTRMSTNLSPTSTPDSIANRNASISAFRRIISEQQICSKTHETGFTQTSTEGRLRLKTPRCAKVCLKRPFLLHEFEPCAFWPHGRNGPAMQPAHSLNACLLICSIDYSKDDCRENTSVSWKLHERISGVIWSHWRWNSCASGGVLSGRQGAVYCQDRRRQAHPNPRARRCHPGCLHHQGY
ncbi:uncharacterized protein LAESUDRAFT_139179 [Laetiporus sulphureus 93-53]|uniref:Uncharacterized protein n=1 Tax=Laetiporus sulphureus 93-53 TaxID=1314785 RepID=A0A165EDY9_9APHY|nr:uncharacterized protein LAESUDRAFT_139179 [Laetiporus sulphureus 93-53]KZT06832.1 hypothetical protein LAESUDRAFT_139179 [Laetiporus sulphureus 93-53]